MVFEQTIPASEGAKTVHTLDRAATVTGLSKVTYSSYDVSSCNTFDSLWADPTTRSPGSIYTN
jgi:hypothetical protein